MNDEMCNFYIMFFYDAKKYAEEPPGMCRWGYLDDNLKFPAGSDIYEGKVPAEDSGKSFMFHAPFIGKHFRSMQRAGSSTIVSASVKFCCIQSSIKKNYTTIQVL